MHLDTMTAAGGNDGDIRCDNSRDTGLGGSPHDFVDLAKVVIINNRIYREICPDTLLAASSHYLMQVIESEVGT